MNAKSPFSRAAVLLPAALIGFSLFSLAGCGGGSSPTYNNNGGSSSTGPSGPGGSTSVTIDGTLDSTSGSPLSGHYIYFDKGTANEVSAVSGTNGSYTLVIPDTSVTGSDTLSVYDVSGELTYSQPITVNTSQTTINVTTTITPPSPPSSLVHK